ncbi:MAG TPA: CHAP domain-containing protein [Syntrophomonadaceae bacterium]|nr:CHAP domain-containing protein [Syntrophomonadaceae bacterium]
MLEIIVRWRNLRNRLLRPKPQVRRSRAKMVAGIRVLVVIAVIMLITWLSGLYYRNNHPAIGQAIDEYRGVTVYCNGGQIDLSHGQHYSPDGYYYGQKWQCVEFAKRFYYVALHHAMPDTYGNASDFWDEGVAAGQLNYRRGLLQYRNGGEIPPQVDDLLVFTNGAYGHVAVISKVEPDQIEVVQQNVAGHSRQKLAYSIRSGRHYIGDGQQPAGWLRLEK